MRADFDGVPEPLDGDAGSVRAVRKIHPGGMDDGVTCRRARSTTRRRSWCRQAPVIAIQNRVGGDVDLRTGAPVPERRRDARTV